MTESGLSGPDVIRYLCDFRNGVRPRIVQAIADANGDDVRRPGVIRGGVGDGSVFAAFVHIVDVEESWLHEQLLGEELKDGPDPERYRDVECVAAIWEQVGADWESYLDGKTERDLAAQFEVVPGASVPTFVIVLHVFNHTTHHRAEIWTALTSFGEHPPELEVLDYADPRA